jgi:Tol biopolymer transport system component
MKALEKDRGLRYQTASELRTDLVRLKRDTEAPLSLARAARSSDGTASTRRISRRAVWITGLGLAVLAAIAVVSWRSVRERIFPSELQEIQLTTNSSENPVNAAAISPDGKYLAYADRAGIHLQLIDSRETHTVVAPEIRDIHNIYWFPDGSKLIVSGVETPGERAAIWSVSILGADRRKLRNDGLQASISSDGSQIAFLDSARTQVWVMGPNGEEPRVAVTAGPGDTFYSPGFSGGRLWYGRVRLVADKTAGVRSEISAESLRDGDINVALSDPGLRGVVLLPDGRLLYSIVAQRQLNQGGSSLWIARLDEATGLISRQRRVHDWAGTVSLWQFTASADGKRVVCLKRSIQKDVYVADLPSHGKPTNPRRVTLDDSIDVGANWTPDGKALLFFSDRNGSFDIFKQSLDAPTAEPIVSGPDDELGPTAVSSDGAWFYYLVRRPRSRTQTPAVDAAVMRTAAAGGPRETLADDSKFHSVLCAKAPSTTCIVIERDGTELSIYTVNPDNVRARKIATTDIIGAQAPSAISPDGSKVAVQMPAARRIRVLFLNGDAPLDIPLPDRPLDGDAFYWSADGAGVYVSSAGPGGTDLLHVDLNGGVNIVWQQSVREWMSGIPSPDGRHIALTQSSAISNVWMLKDFR